MSAKNWKFYYKQTEHVPLVERIVNTVILWSIIGLFWMSFFSTVEEHYPDFVLEPGISTAALILWLFLLWLLYEVIAPKMMPGKHGMKCLAPGMNAIIFLGYFLKNHIALITGFMAVASNYMKDYNKYYGTSYYINAGTTEGKALAFTFMAWVLWMILWNLAYGLKKKWILIAFPLLPIILQLAVGLSPVGKGIDYFFIGALLLIGFGITDRTKGVVHTERSRKSPFFLQRLFAKGILLFLVLVAVLISNFVYKDEMEELAARKQEVLNWQDEVLGNVSNFDVLGFIDVQFDKEILNNNTPVYTGAHILTVTLDQAPAASVYLKGYQGSKYENSVWTGDYSYFTKECAVHGKDTQTVSEALAQSGYDQIGGEVDNSETKFQIDYKIPVVNVAYVPYFTDYSSLEEDCTIKGDFLVQKKISNHVLSGTCHNVWLISGSSINQMILSSSEDYSLGEYSWYDSLAEKNNRSVPEELIDLFDSLGLRGKITVSDNPVETARGVRDYLHSVMVYSMELDTLPAGVDPVVYALTEGHEGYCMHFASAGTLILRYLGVPARYVSGYVAHKSTFEAKSGKYVSVVRDRSAHAWVEIYIDGLGWVPVEMTPGYEANAEKLPTEPDSESTETEKENPNSQTEESSQAESESQESESGPKQNTEPESESESQKDSQNESEGNAGTQQSSGKNGEEMEQFWKNFGTRIGEILTGILWILVIAAFGAAIYLGRKRWIVHYHSVLQKAVDRKHTRRAVKRIHRRMYGYLRIRKHILLKWMKDKEMEALLIETFTEISEEDWHFYMEIAKKMHYSREEISEEEMLHCYHCYKEVSKEFFKA